MEVCWFHFLGGCQDDVCPRGHWTSDELTHELFIRQVNRHISLLVALGPARRNIVDLAEKDRMQW
jgi:hypothetical protein